MITKEKIRFSAIYNGDQLVYFEHLLSRKFGSMQMRTANIESSQFERALPKNNMR